MQVGWGGVGEPCSCPYSRQEGGQSWEELGRGQAQPGRQQAAGGQAWWVTGAEGKRWANRETSSCPESRAQPRQVSWVNALHLNSPGRS